jgi:hypothetical protein
MLHVSFYVARVVVCCTKCCALQPLLYTARRPPPTRRWIGARAGHADVLPARLRAPAHGCALPTAGSQYPATTAPGRSLSRRRVNGTAAAAPATTTATEGRIHKQTNKRTNTQPNYCNGRPGRRCDGCEERRNAGLSARRLTEALGTAENLLTLLKVLPPPSSHIALPAHSGGRARRRPSLRAPRPSALPTNRRACRIVYVSRPHGSPSPRDPPRAGGAAGAAGAARRDERVEGRRRRSVLHCNPVVPRAPACCNVWRKCNVTCCDPVVPRAAFPNALQRLPGVESAAGVDDGVHAGQPPAGYSRSLPLPPSHRPTIRRPPLCRFSRCTPVALVARCVSRVASCACRCNRPTRRGVPVGRPVRPRLQAQAVFLLSPAERARPKRCSCLARPCPLIRRPFGAAVLCRWLPSCDRPRRVRALPLHLFGESPTAVRRRLMCSGRLGLPLACFHEFCPFWPYLTNAKARAGGPVPAARTLPANVLPWGGPEECAEPCGGVAAGAIAVPDG